MGKNLFRILLHGFVEHVNHLISRENVAFVLYKVCHLINVLKNSYSICVESFIRLLKHYFVCLEENLLCLSRKVVFWPFFWNICIPYPFFVDFSITWMILIKSASPPPFPANLLVSSFSIKLHANIMTVYKFFMLVLVDY